MATRFIGRFFSSQTLEIIIPTPPPPSPSLLPKKPLSPLPKKEINKLLALIEIKYEIFQNENILF